MSDNYYYCFGDVAFLFCMIFAGLVCLHEYLKIKKKTSFKPIWSSLNQFVQVKSEQKKSAYAIDIGQL